MKIIKILTILVVSITIITSCKKNNEEDLYGNVICDTSAVKYSTIIAPIMAANCNICHNSTDRQGGIATDSYLELKKYATVAGSLVGSVKQDGTFSSMPRGGAKLSNCDINKIEKWVSDGAPNN
jgi:mono/diheme cytochrome c family protein